MSQAEKVWWEIIKKHHNDYLHIQTKCLPYPKRTQIVFFQSRQASFLQLIPARVQNPLLGLCSWNFVQLTAGWETMPPWWRVRKDWKKDLKDGKLFEWFWWDEMQWYKGRVIDAEGAAGWKLIFGKWVQCSTELTSRSCWWDAGVRKSKCTPRWNQRYFWARWRSATTSYMQARHWSSKWDRAEKTL